MGIAGMACLLLPVLLAEAWRRKTRRKKQKYFVDALGMWLEEHLAALRKASAGYRAQMALLGEEEEAGMASFRKHFRRAWYCLFAGCCLAAVLEVTEAEKEPVTELSRAGVGEGERVYELEVEGLSEGKTALEVIVEGREPSDEELTALFDEAAEELKKAILNGNPSLENVSGDLSFPEQLTGGIWAVWNPQEPERISFLGEVDTEGVPPEGSITGLNVTLKYGDREKTYQIPVRLIPPQFTEKAALEKEILRREAENPERGEVRLPKELDGRKLVFTKEQESQILPALLLFAAVSAAIASLPARKLNQRMKRRETELLTGYAAMVSKLSVLTGAGLSLRGAWKSMAAEYQEKRRKGVRGKDYVYEEISVMVNQMEQGIGEARAYGAFGRRCGLYPYLRLSSILEQNLQKGTRGLQGILQQEVQNALEERKNLARKMGEEAGTKLLAPMFLMLGIVLVIIAVPAFLSF